MASKSELESQNALLLSEVENLKQTIESLSNGESVSIQDNDSSSEKETINALLKDLENEKKVSASLTTKVESLENTLSALRDDLSHALAANTTVKNKPVASTTVYTAKEIHYLYHRREVDDDVTFVALEK